MKMYHGTYMIVDAIDLTKSRNRVDFGKGFYLTDKVGTARKTNNEYLKGMLLHLLNGVPIQKTSNRFISQRI